MRARFSDLISVKAKAKEAFDSGIVGIRSWWCKKYNLPPNHSLYLERTIPELNQEMYEDAYKRRAEILDELEDPDDVGLKRAADLREQVNSLNKVLGLPAYQEEDDLVDKWERELAEGRVPDLDE